MLFTCNEKINVESFANWQSGWLAYGEFQQRFAGNTDGLAFLNSGQTDTRHCTDGSTLAGVASYGSDGRPEPGPGYNLLGSLCSFAFAFLLETARAERMRLAVNDYVRECELQIGLTRQPFRVL